MKNSTAFIADLDIKAMMTEVGVFDTNTRTFLQNSQSLLLENRIEELDQWVRHREISLKGQRSKLLKANEYDPRNLDGRYSY